MGTNDFNLKRLIFCFLLTVIIFIPYLSGAQNAILLGGIPADREIDAVALSPDTGIAYGISDEEKALYIFDLKNYTIKKEIRFNKKPRGLAVNPLNNFAYITAKGDRGHHGRGYNHDDKDRGVLFVVNPDGDIINALTIPKDPQGIAINPDTSAAVIAIEKAQKLIVLSLDTFTITQEIPLPNRPELVSLDTDSNRAAVVASKAHGEGKQNRLLIVDLGTGTVVNIIEFKKEIKDVAVDIEKDIAVVTEEEGITLIDINTGEVVHEIKDDEEDHESRKGRHHKHRHEEDHLDDIESVDINQSTHIAVITKEEGFLLLNLNDRSFREYHLDNREDLKTVAIDIYRNTAIIAGKIKGKRHHKGRKGILIEVQLPNPVPEISNLVPDSARVGDSGFTLRVEGERFITTSTVQFNQNELSTKFIDNKTLEATVPSTLLLEPGSVPVTVTNPPPEGGTSEPYPFIIKYPAPVLTSIVPDTVPAKSPDFTLKVYGANFRNGYIVNLNGEDLATTYVNSGELHAIVPATLIQTKGQYPVVVISTERQNSNVLYLTVIEPKPVINNFAPKEGTPGTVVTITGENLNYSPKVSFAGIDATVLSYTSTELKTIVPPAAQTGPITIITTGGSAETQEPFTVLARQDFSLNVSPSSASIPSGGSASFVVGLTSTGTEPFTGIVKLSANNPDITVRFEPEYISDKKTSLLTLTATTTLQAPTTITISGKATINGVEITREATLTLNPVVPGTTTLSGQVFASKDGRPIKGVTLTIGDMTTSTDDAGNFIFIDPPAGEQVLIIDGDTANHDGITYPSRLPVPVTITGGQDNKLPYPVYLHEVKTDYYTVIDSTKDTIVSDPEIPDFQMLIPAGTVITGWDGKPNEKISVTMVPVDRLPIKPPPDGVYVRNVFMYYFFKPGGGIPNRPVPVVMPNEAGALPGERVTLWYYDESPEPDPDSNQWKVFGMGTVSPDGKTIIPDPGVGIPKFCCGASFPSPPSPPPPPPPSDDCPKGIGDPVDPRTGVFYLENTDMSLKGRVSLEIKRIYRTMDNSIGPFGRGSSWNWGDTIYVMPGNNQALTLVTEGGAQYIFSREPDGSYTNTRWPFLRGRKIVRNPDGTLTEYMKDGTIRKYRIYNVTMARLYQIMDRNGNTFNLELDSSGNPVKIADSTGRGFTITYSGSLISSITDHSGRKVTYGYDQNSNLISVTNPEGGVTYYTYDTENRMVSVTNPRGITVVTNEYDADGRVIRQTHADGGVYTFDYKIAGGIVAVAKVTDPNGNTTSYRFRNYYIASITDPYGQTTYYDRDYATNFLLSVTDPLGRVTRYTYDSKGNRTSIIDPAGNTTIMEYDQKLNRPVKITDALGNVTTMTYDSKGNLTSVVDQLGNSTTISYNKYGQPVSVTDALGNTTTFEYDEYGNLIKTTDPLGNSSTLQYDTLSRLISITDARGRTIRYTYDIMDRITEVIDPMNSTTGFTYDLNGNLLSVTDAKGQTIRYEYDERDRLVKMTDQLGRVETYAYDYNDNLIKVVDRKGQVTRYTYDRLNRIVRVDYADGSYTTYTYDAVGRLTYIYDSISGPIEYVYSDTGCSACGGAAVDKVVQEITPLGSISYEYDLLGRRTKMQVAGQPAVNYEHDAVGRLVKISTLNLEHGMLEFTFGYDALGRRTSLTYPNGVTTTYSYDNASRLTELKHLNPLNQILEKIGYNYDRNGNRTAMDRLNVAPKLPAPVASATYNSANQMLTFQPKGDVNWNMTYDENGNLTSVTNSCGTTTFTWDARNRLVAIEGFDENCNPLSATFKYDALGRRIEKTVNGRTVQYLYDGLDIVQEIEDGMVRVNYIRTLNIDEPLARISSDGTIRYYHADALGSIIALTDETGQIRTQYNYSPFGETELIGEPSDNPFQYTGRENDGTGLYYYRFRYYSPYLKRFISEDPIGLMGGDVNYYVYVWNSPLRWIDPFGFWGSEYGLVELAKYGPNSSEIQRERKIKPLGPILIHTVPITVGITVTGITGNARLGFLSYELTETVLGLIFEQPAGVPKIPISPIINPPCAE